MESNIDKDIATVVAEFAAAPFRHNEDFKAAWIRVSALARLGAAVEAMPAHRGIGRELFDGKLSWLALRGDDIASEWDEIDDSDTIEDALQIASTWNP